MRLLILTTALICALGALALGQGFGPSAPSGPATTAAPARPAPPSGETTAASALRPVAPPGDNAERRCAPDGATCIAGATYAADVCRVVEQAAGAAGIDAGFFARLLWRESLFDALAVSPVGAQGIAQFMPGTAALRGLGDPFNPTEAILASADYLADLEGMFGNLGLAAVAYNGGEERAALFVAGTGGLAAETRAYVTAITGHPAEAWRDALGEGPQPETDYRLDGDTPFGEACLVMAERRDVPELTGPSLMPWAAVIAAQARRVSTEGQVARLLQTHGSILADERIDYARTRVPGVAQMRETAQVGRPTREEAEVVCAQLNAARAPCMVLRN